MIVLNFILGVLKNIGPVICVALLVWGVLGVRGCYRTLFPKDHFVGNMTSVIEDIRSVNKLKVLRVVDAGLDTYPALGNEEARKDGHVDYQYSGVVDLFVDLSKMTVETSPSNTFVISLADVEMTPVRELELTRNLPLDPADKLSVEPYRMFTGSKSVQDSLYDSLAKIQAESVKKSAGCEANVARAKKQAEKLLRYMFLPFVENAERDIVFKWPSDVAAGRD
ncbi:MAG: hypothetical protein IJV91_00695 [Kiritimatiellae bacterium]|nr:hypothetical protein [Kiritimatiellia bacterium]